VNRPSQNRPVVRFSAIGTKLATAEFTYDVFDRRIARKVDADGNGVFETTQRFVYDGEDLILAFSGTTNVLTNRYLYGPATDEILADEKITTGTAGTVTWSLGDNLGTIRDLVQYNAATGTTTVVNHVRYDTFGQIVGQTNSTYQPWFAYTGREWDPAVGLYFYRARWYDPRAGRFTSEDPLGFAAGDVNLSRYVGNAATLWVDPSGMENKAPSGGVAATPAQTGTIHIDDVIVPEVGQSLLIDYRPADQEYVRHMRVYMEYWPLERLWNWCWGVKNIDDCLGILTYDIRDEYAKQEAELVAHKLRVLAGCGKLKAHVDGAVEVTRIGVQVATPLLDDMVDLVEFVHKPNLPNGVKLVLPAGLGIGVGFVSRRLYTHADALDDGLSIRKPDHIGIKRLPLHHVFPQELRDFFKARGFHDIDRYLMPLDDATHQAIHKWMGCGPWNDVMRARILQREAELGRFLTRREILLIGAQMRREAGLSHIKIVCPTRESFDD
jgi:RHS repeat-associated protein